MSLICYKVGRVRRVIRSTGSCTTVLDCEKLRGAAECSVVQCAAMACVRFRKALSIEVDSFDIKINNCVTVYEVAWCRTSQLSTNAYELVRAFMRLTGRVGALGLVK